ncbi:hypothetical protein I7I48_07955 [Histoplasma ohiense]|nr:hypothetical protein I7I48_07955 [Histoplasma ohiense (nom. inval.)]
MALGRRYPRTDDCGGKQCLCIYDLSIAGRSAPTASLHPSVQIALESLRKPFLCLDLLRRAHEDISRGVGRRKEGGVL